MRIHEIAPDLFKPQADALNRQQQELKKKARLKVQKTQAALTKAQQS